MASSQAKCSAGHMGSQADMRLVERGMDVLEQVLA